MATTAVLAQGTTAGTQSAELTHVAGTPKTYTLVGKGKCKLMFKDSTGSLGESGTLLDSAWKQSYVLDCNGVVRWERVEGNCGVDQS